MFSSGCEARNLAHRERPGISYRRLDSVLDQEFLQVVGVVEVVVGQTQNAVGRAEIVGFLLVGDGNGSVRQSDGIRPRSHSDGCIYHRPGPASGAVFDVLRPDGGLEIFVLNRFVVRLLHGERAAAGVENHVGNGLLTAHKNLPGVVASTEDVRDGNSDCLRQDFFSFRTSSCVFSSAYSPQQIRP